MGTTETGPDGSCELSPHLEEFDVSVVRSTGGSLSAAGPDEAGGAVGVIVFIDDWGQWRLPWRFRRDGALLLVLFFSLRFVWALLRRLVACSVQRRRGVWWHLLGLRGRWLRAVVGLAYLVRAPVRPYIEDWRRGTVRHENVACQNFHTELSTGKRSHREYVFDLVAEDGTEWNYRIRASAAVRLLRMSGNPTSVYYTCTGEGEDGLSIVLYEHTGIITEAWTNQAGQVN